MPRGLILALGFLTRLPMPALADFKKEELSSSAIWFPLVGLFIGLLFILAAQLGVSANHWLAALLVVLAWIGITGALHLDGAADLADALGATHRDPERFHAVMKDPHTGSFGVVSIVAILITKLVTVAWLVESSEIYLWGLLLIPAWARLGAIYWSQSLEPLAPGIGESFAWQVPRNMLWIWAALLFALSLFAVSLLFSAVAIISLLLWRAYLKWRLGGMTGDCLGAGIEYCECLMLIAIGLL
ncbi:adenosylcobinamide-GDP ribazoletransferase [Pseudomonadota bacterium]